MKLSISLPEKHVAFIDRQVAECGEPSRSMVVRKAIELLLAEQLVEDYERAFAEWEAGGEQEVWDEAAGDGLDDESW